MTIRDAIKEIIKNDIPPLSQACRVTAVDEEKSVCDVAPIDGSAEILDVLLLAEQSDQIGMIKIPAVDSVVYVTFISKDLAFVSLIAELTKVSIKIKDISLTIDEEQISLNGENLGGIVDAKELKTQLDKNSGAIDQILNAINNSVTGVSDGGALLQTNMKLIIAGAKTADLSNIENEKVKHGN